MGAAALPFKMCVMDSPLPGSTECSEVQPESANALINTTREKPAKWLRRNLAMLGAITT
jgi:hypothetical protein